MGVVLLATTACPRHEPVSAVGPNDEISVLTNTDPKGAVAEELRRLLAYPVEVVGREDAFRLDFIPYHRFEIHRHVKNQLFAVDLSGNDDLARALPRMLESVAEDKLTAKEPFLLLLRDLWGTGQTSLFAVAWSGADLRRLLAESDSTQLRRSFENAVVDGLEKTIFLLGEERVLSAQIAQQYGWTMRLSPGFFAAEDPKGNMVKFNADEPVRLLMVHWREGELPLETGTWNPILSEILDVYNDGDLFLPERTNIFEDEFQGTPALKWEGVWQNEKYVIGGPFRAFAFHRQGTSYLLIGIVFNPGSSKVYLLRQVEALLGTFRLVT
jgi:hypothetical protein